MRSIQSKPATLLTLQTVEEPKTTKGNNMKSTEHHVLAGLACAAALSLFASNSQAQCTVHANWKQIGPSPFIDTENSNLPDSGEVVDIAIDPSGTTDRTIYIAAGSGGVWKTTDGGNNWRPKTDFMPSISIGAVALDPGDPSVVYAGTGNAFNNGDYFKAIGIYKSIDGGDTWTILGGNIFANVAIYRIVLPLPNVLLVASANGVYQSSDAGTNYTLIKAGNATDIDVDAASASTVYASIAGSGLFKLVNVGGIFSLAGNLFTSGNGAPVNFQYLSFAQSKLPNNQTMYINVQLPGPVASMFKSITGGATWSQVSVANNDAEFCDGECGYAQTIGVDPQDPNRVYFGVRSLCMSIDGGATGITTTNRIDLYQVHSDQHALTFSPLNHATGQPTPIYTGTDGGFAKNLSPQITASHDGGGWIQLNGGTNCSGVPNALATILFRQIDMGRGSAFYNAYTYGVTQDQGVSSHTPDLSCTSWRKGYGGDGYAIAVDPLNGKHAVTLDNGVLLTTTDGSSWGAGPSGFPAPPRWVYFDPNGGVAYASGNGNGNLYRSGDNGGSFTLMHTFPQSVTGSGVSIAMSKANSSVVWVGLSDGTVAQTSDANLGSGSHWSADLQIPGAPFQGTSGIAVDPGNVAQVVVVYPAGKVFRTADGGTTWANITGNLPNGSLWAVVVDPNTSPHSIIVAGIEGVMRSMDFGASWQTLGEGLPHASCTSLVIDSSTVPSVIRVGTYGRSAWELAYTPDPVSNLSDSGCGSLRQAITDASSGASITFAPGLNGAITLSSAELLVNKDLAISGPVDGRILLSGNSAHRVFNQTGGTLMLSNLTIANGNINQPGGAIFSQAGSALILNNCTFANNHTSDSGGAIANNGTVLATNCTFSGNQAGDGGCLYNYAGSVTLRCCTICSNSAANGGGFYNYPTTGSTANIGNCIIANNSASSTGPDVKSGSSPPTRNQFVSAGYNLIGKSDSSRGFSDGVNQDQVGTIAAPLDPKLGPLMNNGGSTSTHPLLSGSPAVDKGNSQGATTDQRGKARPVDLANSANAGGGDGTDIGAMEVQLPWLSGITKSGDAVDLTLNCEFGQQYKISYENALSPGFWTDLIGPFTANGTNVPLMDPSAGTQPKRFYRAQLLP